MDHGNLFQKSGFILRLRLQNFVQLLKMLILALAAAMKDENQKEY